MPNIANLLKSEISRVARKEVRGETKDLKRAVAPYRLEIAALKRRMQALEEAIRKLSKAPAAAPNREQPDGEHYAVRFSASRLAAQRKRMGLSARDFGLLIGASTLSVYKWEKGDVRPRAKHLAAIASVRKIGKRELASRLKTIGDSQ